MRFIDGAGRLATGLMRHLDAETAHGLALRTLKSGLVPGCGGRADPRLVSQAFGMRVPNPLGMAAGFDKNGEVPDALLRLGFGFAEVGTVTPLPQAGNPRPRLFRLPEVGGVINRLGFNNEGHAALLARLEARAGRSGVVGVNIGANKESPDRTADYIAGVRAFARFASFFTVNVSSPNTPGLRDLQARDALDALLQPVLAARDEVATGIGRTVPVLLKIAPDVTDAGLEDIADVALAREVDGLIVSNTTISRDGLSHPLAHEAGGLSGRPLFRKSTIVLAKMRRLVGPDLLLIGVGGISSADDAFEKIAAGADLLQLYSGFVYGGPGLIGSILDGLSDRLDRTGAGSLRELRDGRVAAWAEAVA